MVTSLIAVNLFGAIAAFYLQGLDAEGLEPRSEIQVPWLGSFGWLDTQAPKPSSPKITTAEDIF